MGSRKLVFVLAVQLYLESCSVLAQCIQVPQSCSAPVIQPVTQFVIPAVIKPLIQETCVQSAPSEPTYFGSPGFESSGFSGPGFGGFPAPYGGMPPIIYDDSGDGGNKSWLYLLILLLSRRFGGGCCGYGGYGDYGGGCGGCCSGGCGCCCSGGCGGGCGGACGGGRKGGCGCCCENCCGCGCGCCCGGGSCKNCGSYGNGCCGCCGGCGCNGNGCGCGCTYLPYPVPYQPYLYNSIDNTSANENGVEVTYPACDPRTPEINLIVKTDSCCSTGS